jgi:hypothetical protein
MTVDYLVTVSYHQLPLITFVWKEMLSRSVKGKAVSRFMSPVQNPEGLQELYLDNGLVPSHLQRSRQLK